MYGKQPPPPPGIEFGNGVCPACKKPVGPDTNFCPYCGNKIVKPATPAGKPIQAQPPEKNQGCGCIIVLVAIILFSLVLYSCSGSGYYKNEPSEPPAYEQAVTLAKQGKWNDVAVKLVREKDNRSKYLYSYASAQKEYSKGNILMTISYLKDIPDDFNGDFSEEIKQFKATVYPLEAEYKAKRDAEEAEKRQYKESHLYIGDPEKKITQVKGQPYEVNRTVIGNSVHKQYVYYNEDTGYMQCIYTEDGFITGWQD